MSTLSEINLTRQYSLVRLEQREAANGHKATVIWLTGLPGSVEVHCKCPIEICEKRDAKYLYARARAGSIAEYTGVSAPYEEPRHPELTLDTVATPAGDCARQIAELLVRHDIISGTRVP